MARKEIVLISSFHYYSVEPGPHKFMGTNMHKPPAVLSSYEERLFPGLDCFCQNTNHVMCRLVVRSMKARIQMQWGYKAKCTSARCPLSLWALSLSFISLSHYGPGGPCIPERFLLQISKSDLQVPSPELSLLITCCNERTPFVGGLDVEGGSPAPPMSGVAENIGFKLGDEILTTANIAQVFFLYPFGFVVLLNALSIVPIVEIQTQSL
uniref:Uncharacterized protein n=1 Tax=Salix viminalis TaxID=40686 RepID=A0A6N2LCN9_SALVM